MNPADWLWIPVTVWAAFAQTVRNAAQRHLTAELGTLGATLVRFLYGLPFAVLWLLAVQAWTGAAVPGPGPSFALWVLMGAVSQIAATALLLLTMQARNFALGVAYSKTEVLQVAVFGLIFLGDRVSLPAALAARIEADFEGSGYGDLKGRAAAGPVDPSVPSAQAGAGRVATLGVAWEGWWGAWEPARQQCPPRRDRFRKARANPTRSLPPL